MPSMKLAQKLEQVCAHHGTSQAELARLTGASKNTIPSWFTGKSVPDLQQALIIARHFDVSIEWLADDKLDLPIESASAVQALTVQEQDVLRIARRLGYACAMARLLNLKDDAIMTGGDIEADDRAARGRHRKA